jgi:hypothetical protein
MKPKYPQFTTMHQILQESHFSPHFHGAIAVIDGTHIPVIVPSSIRITHFGRYRYTTKNVMVVCDFDMKFTFIVAGWPDSVRDTRVFNEALQKYTDKFPFSLEGINITIVLFIVWTFMVLSRLLALGFSVLPLWSLLLVFPPTLMIQLFLSTCHLVVRLFSFFT